MAEEFLEPIYEEANLLWELRQVVEWIKVDDAHHSVMTGNALISKLCSTCQKYTEQNSIKGRQLWSVVQQLTNVGEDLIFMGDVIERIIPLLEEKMRLWGDIETENEEGDFRFETSQSGFLTMKDLKNNRYFHSKIDPMWEARKRAEYIFDPTKDSYSILGCGLGYLIYQLYLVTDGSVVINVFEKDARIVEYARSYGVLDWIPEDKVNVVIDSDILTFLNSAKEENVGFYLFPPELASEPEDVRAALEEICVQFNTAKRFVREREINVWRNIRSNHKLVKEFDTTSLKEDFIVIAAGPSLDENLDFLRENRGKKTLLAVGTVFKKLLENQIVPDLVVVTDPQARTYKQIEGIEDQEVPLLIGMSAYWKFAAAYQGDKYLIPTMDMEEIAEFAKERKVDLWRCGGTVTAMAIEVANRFGANQIYLVGVDLAFPNGITHATGTMDRSTKNLEQLIPVEGVGNQIVYTERVFIGYRNWIEEMITITPQIKYYNMSRIGAKIVGAEEVAFENE